LILGALAPPIINGYLAAFPNVVNDLDIDMCDVQLTLAVFLALLVMGSRWLTESPTSMGASRRCMPGCFHSH